MPLPNVTGEIISQGYNCHVRVGTNASDAQSIALVTTFRATEDFQVQEAVCIGNLGPVALDPQGYNCQLSIDGFLPFKKILDGAQQYADRVPRVAAVGFDLRQDLRHLFLNGGRGYII